MAYIPNPKKAENWVKALSAGTAVFEQIEEETKAGFTRPLLLQIIKPMWPFFEQQLPEDVEQLHLDMEEFFDDFWKDYNEIVADLRRKYPEDEIDLPKSMFFSRLGMVLEHAGLYDQLRNV